MTTIHTILMQMMQSMCDCKAMKAEKLAFLTDIEGVYKDPQDSSTLISELTVSEAHKLVGDGYIGGGMLRRSTTVSRLLRSGGIQGSYSGWKNSTLPACLKSLQTKELVQLF